MSKFTQRHHAVVAEALKSVSVQIAENPELWDADGVVHYLTGWFESTFQRDNDRFSVAKFEEAALARYHAERRITMTRPLGHVR